MAILNGIEGQAHVESEDDDIHWKGYILVEPNPSNLRYFDVSKPSKNIIYEGPIFRKGIYYFGHGRVQILEVDYSFKLENSPDKMQVEFKGIESMNNLKALKDKPKDYLD
jgi:hypothetical protein